MLKISQFLNPILWFIKHTLLGLGFLTSIYLFILTIYAEVECVKLPNDLIVSRDSILNVRNIGFRPNVVIKTSGGVVLSHGNGDNFYFSKTTAWWVDVVSDENGIQSDDLAYRWDTGLVRQSENPELYSKIISEAGPPLEEGKLLNNTNVLGVLEFLTDDLRYNHRDCSVPLISDKRGYP